MKRPPSDVLRACAPIPHDPRAKLLLRTSREITLGHASATRRDRVRPDAEAIASDEVAARDPRDDVVASTNSVNADCKNITPDRVVAVASTNPVIAWTAGDGLVLTEGANEIVPAPAIDGVGSVRPTITSLASVPMIVPDLSWSPSCLDSLGQPRRQPSLVVTVRVGKAPRQRGVRTQNSLPSGSVKTVHDTSPWPTSMSVAPRARSRATSAA